MAAAKIPRRGTPPNFTEAIINLHRGDAPMSSKGAARVVAYFHEHGRKDSELERLSADETEILDCLAKGYLYKEIADTLDVTYQTANGHSKNIYENICEKLHVRSCTEAVIQFLGK